MSIERGKDNRVGANESTLGTIASREVLRSDYGDRFAGLRLHQQNLAVIICKVGAFDNLCDERPKFQRLVSRLMVENKVDTRNFLILADKEQAAEKFFGNRERSLPYFRYADLRENPIENVGNLNSVRKIRLIRSIFQRFKNFVYVGGSFHDRYELRVKRNEISSFGWCGFGACSCLVPPCSYL